jgi:hypothetical protein
MFTKHARCFLNFLDTCINPLDYVLRGFCRDAANSIFGCCMVLVHAFCKETP